MRADKQKNVIKVLQEVINSKEPITQRDIAENADMSLWCVNSSLKELEQSWTLQEKPIVDFVALDLELQSLILAEKIRRVRDQAKDQPHQALDSFDNTSFKRSQILQGKNSENFWIKNIDSIDIL